MLRIGRSSVLSVGLFLAAVQAAAQVTVYQHTSFGGISAGFGVGDYNLSALQSRGVANDSISSVAVQSGYKVTLYEHDNFGGVSITKFANDSSLVDDGWNDRASSLRVALSTGPTPTPTPPSACSQTGPAANSTKTITCNGLTLTFTDKGGGVSQSVRNTLVQVFFTNYAKERNRFNTSAPASVRLTIDPAYGGVAATGGASVTCSASWLVSHPSDVDGCGTHEFMHVAQAYTSGGNPGWAVEGLADYARYKYGLYNGAAGWSLPAYSSSQHYTNSYRVTARFFVWLENKVRSTILLELDDAMKSGTYSASFWTSRTGKTVDQLWAQYGSNPTL